jgi:hypothetical protein
LVGHPGIKEYGIHSFAIGDSYCQIFSDTNPKRFPDPAAEPLAKKLAALGTFSTMELHHLVAPLGLELREIFIAGVCDHQHTGTAG